MQENEKVKVRIEDGFCRCGNCGHKLFAVKDEYDISGIEIKCHSCKKINTTEEEE